jgi:DNA-binding PucR family transcriptional regulator
MGLPCMHNATLVAGISGLNSIVTAVSVLEYSNPPKEQVEIFTNQNYLGKELVITAFAGIGGDVDKQCAEIQWMSATGAVGVVLYYMGLFVKKLDQRVLELADSLGFIIICMPPTQYHLRYSEAIADIEKAIILDQNTTSNFVPEILDALVSLPKSQQNMNVLLRILSDYLHTTLILTDISWRLLNYAAWPTMLEREINVLIDTIRAYKDGETADAPFFHLTPIKDAAGTHRQLISVGAEKSLTEEIVRQIVSAIQLFWKMSKEENGSAGEARDLICAIIGDEPIRMRKQARMLNIDERNLHNLLLFHPEFDATPKYRTIIDTLQGALSQYCHDMVIDAYSGDIIALLDNGISTQWIPYLRDIKHTLDGQNICGRLLYACNLKTTAEARRAYLNFIETMQAALKLYPHSELLSLHEILFAKSCQNIIDMGEDSVQEKMAILQVLSASDSKQEHDLHDTLTVFYFDAHMKISETAERMYVHKNTVKYRLQKASEKLGSKATDMPEMLELYTALALSRLLKE